MENKNLNIESVFNGLSEDLIKDIQDSNDYKVLRAVIDKHLNVLFMLEEEAVEYQKEAKNIKFQIEMHKSLLKDLLSQKVIAISTIKNVEEEILDLEDIYSKTMDKYHSALDYINFKKKQIVNLEEKMVNLVNRYKNFKIIDFKSYVKKKANK